MCSCAFKQANERARRKGIPRRMLQGNIESHQQSCFFNAKYVLLKGSQWYFCLILILFYEIMDGHFYELPFKMLGNRC